MATGINNEPGATLTVSLSTLTDNDVTDYGGGIFNDGTATLADSTVDDNMASTYDGGGVYNVHVMTIERSTIASNDAQNGAGVFDADILTIMNSTIAQNSAQYDGGGLGVQGGTATVVGTTIAYNKAMPRPVPQEEGFTTTMAPCC